MQIICETERLFLKVIEPGSGQRVLDYYQRNRSFLEEWEPLRTEEFYTLDYHEKLLLIHQKLIHNGESVRFCLFKKNDEKRIIGCVNFSNIVYGAFLSCFLGYNMDKEEINQGFMTEALRRSIAIMFEDIKLHRIEANIMPRNQPSLRVVEKLGFVSEGISSKYLKINGVWEDHIHMVLINDKV